MRLVTFVGVADEIGENEYKANAATQLISTPGLSGGEKHQQVSPSRIIIDHPLMTKFSFDLFFPIGAHLVEYMHRTGVHQFPTGEQKSPFEYSHRMGFWEFFDKNPDQRRYFDDYMATRRVGIATWHETFPFSTELEPSAAKDENAVLLVDVGGGWGHETISYHKAYPGAPGRCILQDRPDMIEKVKKEAPPEGVELMPYDFFTPQPVQGARAYYFRNICHNWPDADCIKILSNTAKSMEKGYSKLLIDEYVIPNTHAPIRGSSMDFLMMMFCSGIERTKSQWEKILDACNLEIVKVWSKRSDFEQVIEAQLKAS